MREADIGYKAIQSAKRASRDKGRGNSLYRVSLMGNPAPD